MAKKSSAHYQRAFRERLREQGLIKKEVWVLPENVKKLQAIEKELRYSAEASRMKGVKDMNSKSLWTTKSLFEALQQEELFQTGSADIEYMESTDPSIHLVMREYGDLPLFMTVVGEQILVEGILWPVSSVIDVARFNETVLRTHKLFPLSTISMDSLGDEGDYYQMFGALSASSILSNVVFEIEVLADNIIKATEAYGEFFEMEKAI